MLTFMTVNTALLRDYSPLVSLNKALLRPYFFGGGGTLRSHFKRFFARADEGEWSFNRALILGVVDLQGCLKLLLFTQFLQKQIEKHKLNFPTTINGKTLTKA